MKKKRKQKKKKTEQQIKVDSPAYQRIIVDRYLYKNATLRELNEEFDLSYDNIRRILNKAKVKRRTQGEYRQVGREIYEPTQEEIAQKTKGFRKKFIREQIFNEESNFCQWGRTVLEPVSTKYLR